MFCVDNRVFDDVRVAWRATFDKDTVQLHREGVSLEKELEAVTGETVCQAGHFSCPIRVGLRPDKVSIRTVMLMH